MGGGKVKEIAHQSRPVPKTCSELQGSGLSVPTVEPVELLLVKCLCLFPICAVLYVPIIIGNKQIITYVVA